MSRAIRLGVGAAWVVLASSCAATTAAQVSPATGASLTESTVVSWGVLLVLLGATWWLRGKFVEYDSRLKSGDDRFDRIEQKIDALSKQIEESHTDTMITGKGHRHG
jgi:TolA-binding protein